MAEPLLLNLSCGHVTPRAWVNVDGSNRAWLASTWPRVDAWLVRLGVLPPTDFANGIQFVNFSKRLPWANSTMDAIYQGEVLEHSTKEDGERLLRECHRVLQGGGVLRLREPDNSGLWQNYLAEYSATLRRRRGERNRDHERWIAMFFRDICVERPGRFGSMDHYQKWMHDEVTLTVLRENLCFDEVARRDFHDSIDGVAQVEMCSDLVVEAVR
jgi:SAM-dependent methyltransferase